MEKGISATKIERKLTEKAIKDSKNAESSLGQIVVTPHGEAVPIPKGAIVPSTPNRGTGMLYQGGRGGNNMDNKTTGVRIMDPNSNQGRRVNYMNQSGQTVDPKTGKTISNNDPRGHIPLR